MAGLNELLKLANKMSGGSVGAKGLADLMAKINEFAKDANGSFGMNSDGVANSTVEKPGEGRPRPESAYANQEPDFEDYDGKQDQDGAVKKSRQRDDKATMNIIRSNNTIRKNDIFNFEFNDEKLVEGLIFSEILGKPLSRRNRRSGHGRIR